MAVAVSMPNVGITVESCVITKWHVKKGDKVKVGDILFSYETDKASMDAEAEVEGEILEIFRQEGEDVKVMTNVAAIGTAGEDVSALRPVIEEESAEEAPAAEQKPAAVEVPAAAPAEAYKAEKAPTAVTVNTGEIKISPRARNLAEKFHVDPRLATPTGPNGRIIERDIQALIDQGIFSTGAAYASVLEGTGIGGRVTVADLAAAASSAGTAATASEPEVTVEKLTNIRKSISKAMVNSLQGMAQLTLNASFDATAVMNFRKNMKENGAAMGLEGITLNDIILFAVSRTIVGHKFLNANLIDDSMHFFKNVHLGIAVDTERGLLVPTLRDANLKSLVQISKEAKELITEAQKGSISPDKLKGASFTITNLGTLDIESFTPVINPPQTGILGVNTIMTRVKEVNGELVTYPAMGLSLTFDHRALDGAPAARFLKELKFNLEHFKLLLAK